MPFEDDLGELVEPPPKLTKVSGKFHKPTVELDTNWKKYLGSLCVKDVLMEKKQDGKRPQLVTVKSTSSIVDVLRTLAVNNILSAPVMESNGSRCLGFVDVLDIEALAFRLMKEGNFTLHEFFSNPFFEKPIRDALGAIVDDWVPVEETTTLLDVLHSFSRQALFRPHRLPVVDGSGDIIGIISQSDVLRIAAEKLQLLDKCGTKTIEEMKLEHAVIAARNTALTSDVLGLLIDNRVHGVAIVEQASSKLLSNFSASDLRGMSREDLELFDKPIEDFLKFNHLRKGEEVHELRRPVSCRPRTTFSEVISLLATNAVHRVYVTDDNHRAVGVVSLGDVVSALKDC